MPSMMVSACVSLPVRSLAHVLSLAMRLMPLSRHPSQVWLREPQIGAGGCSTHPPIPFLYTSDRSGYPFRPKKVGIKTATVAAFQLAALPFGAVLLECSRSLDNRGSRGAYAPREICAVSRLRRRRSAPLPSAPHGASSNGLFERSSGHSSLDFLLSQSVPGRRFSHKVYSNDTTENTVIQ